MLVACLLLAVAPGDTYPLPFCWELMSTGMVLAYWRAIRSLIVCCFCGDTVRLLYVICDSRPTSPAARGNTFQERPISKSHSRSTFTHHHHLHGQDGSISRTQAQAGAGAWRAHGANDITPSEKQEDRKKPANALRSTQRIVARDRFQDASWASGANMYSFSCVR